MKLAGFNTNSPAAQRVAEQGEKVQLDAPVYAVFTPDVVEVEFIGTQHEPVLHVEGAIDSVTALSQLPYDIQKITFDSENQQRFSGFYKFSPQQHKDLIDKGLYLEGFQPPREMMTSLPWELPMNADVTVVAPESQDAPPIVLVGLSEIHGVDFSQESSGYELTSMFEDYRSQREAGEAGTDLSESISRAEIEGKDIFADANRTRTGVSAHAQRLEQERALSAAQLMAKLAGISFQTEPVLVGAEESFDAEQFLTHDLDDTAGMSEWEREVTEFYNEKIRTQEPVVEREIEQDSERETGVDTAPTVSAAEIDDVVHDLDELEFDDVIDLDADDVVDTVEAEAPASISAAEISATELDFDREPRAKTAQREASRRVAQKIQTQESVREAYIREQKHGYDTTPVEQRELDEKIAERGLDL
ncbi:hypothetical protein N24_1885 [Corynebacterium suranareeae]|uniref:Uncharacterized protein n=1 Tax=Corynebacterium suranareeae TaxID=2506452 RepID=A0A160PQ13_9CORY|nr:hypothetical protein [Corynebacterium suranareeae]BAU96147.1 hypothetical protein N24_1885 [Corynebacterium suranareeae]